MKQRIITAIAGLIVLAAVMLLFDTIVLNITISIVAAGSVYELLKACGALAAPVSVPSLLLSAAIPFADAATVKRLLPAVGLVYVVILFCYLLKAHKIISAEKLGFVMFFTAAVSFSASCFIYARDAYGVAGGYYIVMLSLVGAWLNDTGGYFGGMLFGKNKLAPIISPKKTREGFVSGVIVSILSQLLFSYIFTAICAKHFGIAVEVNYPAVAVAGPFIALIGVLGDLSASVVKRQYGVKDYGNIMPGHGGMMDRFDSVLFTLPLVYIIMDYCPLIIIK